MPCVNARVVVISLTEYVLWNSGRNYSGEVRCLFTLVCLYGKNELPRQGFLLMSGNQRWETSVSLRFFNCVINNMYIPGENLDEEAHSSHLRQDPFIFGQSALTPTDGCLGMPQRLFRLCPSLELTRDISAVLLVV